MQRIIVGVSGSVRAMFTPTQAELSPEISTELRPPSMSHDVA